MTVEKARQLYPGKVFVLIDRNRDVYRAKFGNNPAIVAFNSPDRAHQYIPFEQYIAYVELGQVLDKVKLTEELGFVNF